MSVVDGIAPFDSGATNGYSEKMDGFEGDSIAALLKYAASEMMLAVLKKVEGQKDIVLCDQLIASIDLVCSFKEMKNIGVDKIYKLDNVPSVNTKKLCFIIKPTIGDVKKVCNWLNVFQSKEINDLQYWIIFVPQKSYECERYLEQEGLFSYFTILDFPLGFIPFDRDLFSLELNDSYQDYLLLGDYQFLNTVVLGLHQLQKLIGNINLIFAKGRASEFICDHFQKLNALSGLVGPVNSGGGIGGNGDETAIDLLVFDREEDYASLFLSQLNYSGIVDETFNIKSGKVELDSSVVKDGSTAPAKHQLFFGSDRIFADVQDMSFSSVCISLKEKGQKLRQKYHERQSMNLNEMKEFLTKDLRNIQSEHKALFLHINVCEAIMERKKAAKFSEQLKVEQNLIEGIESRASLAFIEEGITRLYPSQLMLRLICLFSLCYSGISNKELHSLMRLYCLSYGFHSILAFFNLKKIGLIFETSNQFNQFNFTAVASSLPVVRDSALTTSSSSSSSASSSSASSQKVATYQGAILSAGASSPPSETIKKFRHVTKKFNLIPLLETESYSVRTPSDCGYVFGGAYYPYVCKLLATFFDLKTVGQIEEWCRGTLCKLQPSLIPNQHSGRSLAEKRKRLQLVLLVGGITYAEVSALRFLATQKGVPILVMTTSITNGSTWLQSLAAKSL